MFAGGGQHAYCRSAEPIFVRRGAHSDELDGAVGDRTGHIGGEVQAAGLHIARHDQVQTGFVDGDAAVFQDLNLAWVDVQAQHSRCPFRPDRPRYQARHSRCQQQKLS